MGEANNCIRGSEGSFFDLNNYMSKKRLKNLVKGVEKKIRKLSRVRLNFQKKDGAEGAEDCPLTNFTENQKKNLNNINTPVIIFMDELDAIGARESTFGGPNKRGPSGGPGGFHSGGGHDETVQTVNQLLHEMDGFAAQTDSF